MYFLTNKKHSLNSIFFTLLCVGGISYFVYHAINGERGLLAFIQLSQQLEQKRAELDIVRAERLYLEHRVTLMRPDSLDLDLVDEQARRLLGYASPSEKVIFLRNDTNSNANDIP